VRSVPKRLRYFLQRDTTLQGAVLRILLTLPARTQPRLRHHRPYWRHCLHPPFALEHLHLLDAEHLIYHNPKPRSDSPRDLVLTPLELIDKIAALIPPPRAHRHRYYGVLAPNSPMRAAVTALAPLPVTVPLPVAAVNSEDPPPRRAASHYLWAMLLARIYESLPLLCPVCQAQMRIIAFITDTGTVRKILDHLGESAQPPRIAPARATAVGSCNGFGARGQ